MRFSLLVLLVFCALISGWTAALAQVQALSGAAPTMRMDQAHSVSHIHSTGQAHSVKAKPVADHSQDAGTCHPPAKMVHPLLCAACFAVPVDLADFARPSSSTPSLNATPQPAMREVILEPRFPPPKA